MDLFSKIDLGDFFLQFACMRVHGQSQTRAAFCPSFRGRNASLWSENTFLHYDCYCCATFFFFCLSRDVDAAVMILSSKSSAMACCFAGYMPERFEESRNEHFLLHLGPVMHPQTWPSFKVPAEVKSAPGDPPAAFCCSD